jgi:hypothetical protein
MSTAVPSQGSENRQQILPAGTPQDLGFFGSPYNPADELPTPAQIGVRAGDNLSDVVNAIKGVAYYTDTIGFGESSTSFTRDMGIRPLGVNYFIPTGQKCSNGADMFQYMEGIPTGSALGKRVQKAMQEMGLPQLRGLAPGMLEDAENALNPMPLMGAVFGSGYPVCQEVELPVGDQAGNIFSKENQSWIGNAASARLTKRDGRYFQKAWIQALDPKTKRPATLSREAWEKAPKTHNPDGTPKKKEGFATSDSHKIIPYLVIGTVLLAGFAIITRITKRK